MKRESILAKASDMFKRGHVGLALKSIGATCLAFLLAYLFIAPFSASLSSIFSTSDKTDFIVPDLFCRIADDRPVRTHEDRIVMLDIGRSNRPEIIETLSLLPALEPKAVILDINFAKSDENDSTLLSTLSSLPNLVLPLGLEETDGRFHIIDKPFFFSHLKGVRYGAANFPTDKEGGSVREYSEFFPVILSDSLPSSNTFIPMPSLPLAGAISAGYVSEREPDNIPQEITNVPIDYPSKYIPIITSEELAEEAEMINGRIVLVGASGDISDHFNTPLRQDMSGLEIHALALSTILDDNRMDIIPEQATTILAFILTFIIVITAFSIKTVVRGLVLRILQVALLYLLVRIGYWLFVDKDILADFTRPILMIAFGLFAVDLWNGTAYLLTKMYKRLYRNPSKCRNQNAETT